MVGSNISHYKILSKLGEGGMGVVYKAEDTKLKRSVALKFLAPHLLRDEEARKRFDREAQAAAALHHPNVCPVYEIGEEDGRTFLAMAFIEGDSLDKRIEQGPLKIPEALDIAQQIAKGLEAAHEKKIVHRDIKPGNVIVDEKGHATVMDFGLALLTEGSKLSQLDTTVGTAAYMSPEQIQGMEVDHRTDIWALGCVLYEMVCGQRPFRGVYDKALLYEIVQEEPEPLTGVRSGIPIELELLVNKCLAKDAKQRYQHADELVVDLESLREKLRSGQSTIGTVVSSQLLSTVESPVPAPAPSLIERRLRVYLKIVGIVAMAALLGIVILLLNRPLPRTQHVTRFSFSPGGQVGFPTVSPNGRHIAYTAGAAGGALWVRDLASQEPRELVNADSISTLFWSPDSRFIGFFEGRELRKVSVSGGPSSLVCKSPVQLRSASWSSDGETILFLRARGRRIYEVPARGGEPAPLLESDDEGERYRGAIWLPEPSGRRAILYVSGQARESRMQVLDLQTNEKKDFGPGYNFRYAPSGHIIYQPSPVDDTVWALPFSLDTLESSGEAFPVAEGANYASVSETGTLVYREGGGGEEQLVWRDRDGRVLGEIGQPQEDVEYPRLSSDGKLVVLRGVEGSNFDIWIQETERPIKARLTTQEGWDGRAAWGPSSGWITFSSDRSGFRDLYTLPSDGSGSPETLPGVTAAYEFPYDWTPDGRYLLFGRVGAETAGYDLWRLERKEGGEGYEAIEILASEFNELGASLSKDGRYVAYSSNESGRYEVYVRRFPGGEGKLQISTQGGVETRWSKSSSELFFKDLSGVLHAVEVRTGGPFSFDSPVPLFKPSGSTGAPLADYDVAADGSRFVIPASIGGVPDASIHVVLNWYEEFRDRDQD